MRKLLFLLHLFFLVTVENILYLTVIKNIMMTWCFVVFFAIVYVGYILIATPRNLLYLVHGYSIQRELGG